MLPDEGGAADEAVYIYNLCYQMKEGRQMNLCYQMKEGRQMKQCTFETYVTR
jgi:hypothetical protein